MLLTHSQEYLVGPEKRHGASNVAADERRAVAEQLDERARNQHRVEVELAPRVDRHVGEQLAHRRRRIRLDGVPLARKLVDQRARQRAHAARVGRNERLGDVVEKLGVLERAVLAQVAALQQLGDAGVARQRRQAHQRLAARLGHLARVVGHVQQQQRQVGVPLLVERVRLRAVAKARQRAKQPKRLGADAVVCFPKSRSNAFFFFFFWTKCK